MADGPRERMIEVEALVRRFGPFTAVDGVSFSVARGEVLGFLGPNGAGKSTTMKMITGFLTPTAGRISVCGHDVVERPIAAKEKIGYLPEGAPAYPDMTPAAFLSFVADVRRLSGAARRAAIDRAVAMVELGDVMEQPIETLSKGFKRRVGLAQAVLHDPPVLILDEPTDGLDPNQKHQVRRLIREMAKDKAIVISTHILEEVDAVCTRALIIARGRIVADGTPAELQARSPHHNAVRLRTPGDPRAKALLEGLPSVARVEEYGDGFLILSRGARPIVPEVSELVRSQGWKVDELTIEIGRLDEVFRELTTERREAA